MNDAPTEAEVGRAIDRFDWLVQTATAFRDAQRALLAIDVKAATEYLKEAERAACDSKPGLHQETLRQAITLQSLVLWAASEVQRMEQSVTPEQVAMMGKEIQDFMKS